MLVQSHEALLPTGITTSRSKPVSAWAVFRATVVKDLQIERRYIPDLIGNGVQLAVRVLFYLLLSGIIAVKGQNSPLGRDMSGQDLFIFFLGGLLLFVFNGTALGTPVNSVTRDLNNGTLEFLYSNPSSRYAYFVGTVVANALISQTVFLPLFVFLCLYSGSSPRNACLVLLVCALVVVTLIALGIMIALLGILWRQVSSVTQVVAIMFELLAGAYFPVSAFPAGLQYIAYLLPYTWGYDLIRYYSFDGQWKTLLPVWAEWLVLGMAALLYTIVSRFLLRKAEQHAKKRGLHLI